MVPLKPATLSELIRLNLFLARYAGISRRTADRLISLGQVFINGKPATLGQKIHPQSDQVAINGKIITLRQQKYLYLILNKPPGYITTTRDQYNRPSVVDLIPKSPRLYPVGRLDYATTGLLLFTNDGQMALRLTHPRYHLSKTYHLVTASPPNNSQLRRLRAGVVLSDGPTQPATAKLLNPVSGGFLWQLSITEGRNRQVRRMCDMLGLKLKSLSRVSLGPLRLGNLNSGHYRYLSPSEIISLKKVVQ